MRTCRRAGTRRSGITVVPTWNYEVVHLHGRQASHDEPAWAARQARDLTDRNELAPTSQWSVDDPPDGYVAKLMRGIVVVELVVDRFDSEFSQNRDTADRTGVMAGAPSWMIPRRSAIVSDRCGCSSMVEHQLPKLNTGVRFSSSALTE